MPEWSNSRRLEGVFRWLVVGWLVWWTVLPVLCVGNCFIDVSENVAWGQNFQLGYDKNPYFGAWLTYWCYWLFRTEYISYLLSQISVLIATVSMWKLGMILFQRRFYALLAVVLMLLVPFFSHSACEFNDDVMEIGLWALLILFFYRAVTGQRLADWLVVGLAAGLAFMTKYLGGVLFVSLGMLLLFTPQGRTSWKKPGLYGAAVIFLALSLPNLIWLYYHDFIAFRYASERAGLQQITLLDHLVSPLRFLGDFVLRLLLPAGALVLFFRRGKERLCASFDTVFLWVAMVGPVVLSALFAAVTGGEVLTSWTTPYYIVCGLFGVMLWRPVPDRFRLKLFLAGFGIFVVGLSLGFGYEYLWKRPYLRRGCTYDSYPGKKLADMLSAEWRRRFDRPLQYVIGDREASCNMTFYGEDMPRSFFNARTEWSPWISPEAVAREGAVLIWDAKKPPAWVERYAADLQYLEPMQLERAVAPWFRALAGQPKLEVFYAAFLPPAEFRDRNPADGE